MGVDVYGGPVSAFGAVVRSPGVEKTLENQKKTTKKSHAKGVGSGVVREGGCPGCGPGHITVAHHCAAGIGSVPPAATNGQGRRPGRHARLGYGGWWVFEPYVSCIGGWGTLMPPV